MTRSGLVHTTNEATSARARTWLLTGLSALALGIALSLGGRGSFAPLLATFGAVVAGIGLHRFGRSGPKGPAGPSDAG